MASDPIRFVQTPIESVDVANLSRSRFLNQKTKQLPFRDEHGRIHVGLLEQSLQAIDEGADCPSDMASRARRWLLHAHTQAHTNDENLTLDELLATATGKRKAPATASSSILDDDRDDALIATVPRPNRRAPLKRLCRTRGMPPLVDVALAKSDEEYEPSDGSSSPAASDDDAAGSEEVAVGVLDTDAESGDDVYEVERILSEGPKGLRIRWSGFDASHDSWEPEANVSRKLVRAWREAQQERTSNAGRDFGSAAGGRLPSQLWCARCHVHTHKDNFSAAQRRVDASRRSCLKHSLPQGRRTW